MNDTSAEDESKEAMGERLVYVIPGPASFEPADDINLRALWSILWRGKWLIIAMAAGIGMASLAYALLATEWYRAEALLTPVEEKSNSALGGQLGGLAALAGIAPGNGDTIEAVATLESREFARDFIEDFQLVQIFFDQDWDPVGERWRGDDPDKWPDIRDAVKYFHKNVLRVSEDRQTRLITLAIEWTDPETAATWANALVRRVNLRLRERALREAETNVSYLQGELSQTGVVTLQQSVGRLLENELQKLMLARGNEEFALRAIDSPFAPKDHIRPKRALIVVIGTLLGGLLGAFGILLAHGIRSGSGSDAGSAARGHVGG